MKFTLISVQRRSARRIVSQEITIRISSAARSSLSVSGRSRRRIVRGTSTISLLDPFERRGSPFSSPTACQGRSLGRQVKLKTFTPALPPHLLLEPGASSYYACNRLYNCVYDYGAVSTWSWPKIHILERISYERSNFVD